jgi:hypothetical protein
MKIATSAVASTTPEADLEPVPPKSDDAKRCKLLFTSNNSITNVHFSITVKGRSQQIAGHFLNIANTRQTIYLILFLFLVGL